MVPVEVGTGARGAGRDGVVVDGVSAGGVGVPNLDHHRPADGVREVLAVGRADEDAPVLGPHDTRAPRWLARNEGIVGQEGDRRIPQTR
jgi:hypothetical protein